MVGKEDIKKSTVMNSGKRVMMGVIDGHLQKGAATAFVYTNGKLINPCIYSTYKHMYMYVFTVESTDYDCQSSIKIILHILFPLCTNVEN